MSMSLHHCLTLLRKGDYERYLAVLFAPTAKREALAALYAFNLEIARIADIVKEPLAGEIRLRWWADQIETIPEKGISERDKTEGKDVEQAGQNPLLAALAGAITHYELPKKPLLAAIEARIADLYPHVFTTRRDFEFYCGETSSVFFQLACQILDQGRSRPAADVSGHAGVADTLWRMLSRFGHGRADISQIPHDILAAIGIEGEALTDSQTIATDHAHLAAALIAYTREHYNAFHAVMHELSAALRPAFLPLAPLPAALRRLERAGPLLFKHPSNLSPLRRQWHITRAAFTGRFGR